MKFNEGTPMHASPVVQTEGVIPSGFAAQRARSPTGSTPRTKHLEAKPSSLLSSTVLVAVSALLVGELCVHV